MSVRAVMAPWLSSAIRVRVAPTSMASVAVSARMAGDPAHGKGAQYGSRSGASPRQLEGGGDGANHGGIRAEGGGHDPRRGWKAGRDARHQIVQEWTERPAHAALEDHELGINGRGNGHDGHRQVIEQLIDHRPPDGIACDGCRKDRLGSDLDI